METAVKQTLVLSLGLLLLGLRLKGPHCLSL
jgi:hypothetical protein